MQASISGLQEAVVVAVHEFLQTTVCLGRQPQITDGADPCLGCGNGGDHGVKIEAGLVLSMTLQATSNGLKRLRVEAAVQTRRFKPLRRH